MLAPMLPHIDDYYWTMAARKRLFYLERAGEPWGLCTFFVLPTLDIVDFYHERKLWSTPPDVSDGPVVYIDKLLGRGFSRTLFQEIEAGLNTSVPSWETAVWFQPSSTGADRRYSYSKGAAGHGHHV